MKAKRTYNRGFVILAALLLFIIFGSLFSIKAIARDKAYFSTLTDQAESEYLKEIKEVLTCNEVYKAGVTMTKTTLDGKKIDYSVLIHTSEYIYDRIENWDSILMELNDLTLQVDNSGVTFSLEY